MIGEVISYSATVLSTLNACKEAYKLNKGANFIEETLFLINLSQPIEIGGQNKPLTEALFDVGTDEFTIAIDMHETTIVNNNCNLNDRVQLEANIKNLRIIPSGESPDNFSFTDLSMIAYL